MNLKYLAVAGALSLSATSVQAATIIVEGFDGLGGGDTSLLSQDFLYDPAQKVNGQCLDGVCLQEAEQSTITEITESPVDGTYDFLGFYVNVNGKVDDGDNLLSISNDSGQTLDLVVLDDLDASPYADLIDVYDESGAITTAFTFDSAGYFVAFKEGADFSTIDDSYGFDIFDGVTSIFLESLSSASIRIDCVALAPDGGALSIGAAELTSCVGDVTIDPIPLPAAGWLLLAGLGGLAAMKRRKA